MFPPNATNVPHHIRGEHDDDGEFHRRKYSVHSQLKQALAGGVAGCLTRSLTQPFDVLKIRFQLQVEPVGSTAKGLSNVSPGTATSVAATSAPSASHAAATHSHSKYTSIFQACRVIYREEGIRAFWKGHNAGQFMSISYAIIQFWSYEQIRLGLGDVGWLSQHRLANNFVSGALAGTIATVIVMPFDVIRTRVVAQDTGAGYKNTFSAFPVILRTEGVRGFFRGLGTTLIQIGPMVGGNFMFYKSLNDVAANVLELPKTHLPPWCLLITGGAAGVASKAILYPLDFIKKRLQMQGFENHRQTFGRNQRCSNIRTCILSTVREEGLIGFYKGMIPTLVKSGLTTAFYFSIYDNCKNLLTH